MDEPTPQPEPKDTEKNGLTEGAKVYSPLEGDAAATQEPVQDSPAPGEEPSIHAVDLPLPEEKRSRVGRLFSTETKFGRFLRVLVRALAVAVILLAAGALAVELLRVRPLNKKYQALQQQATQTAEDLLARQTELEQASQTLTSTRGQAQEVQTSLEVEQARVAVLRISKSLLQTRLYVANKDTAAAEKSLAAAEGDLENLLAFTALIDPGEDETLKALFTLAKGDLKRDQKLFNQDLDRLLSELDMIEKALQE